VKNGEAIPPHAYTPSWRGAHLINHRDRFTFLPFSLFGPNYVFNVFIHDIVTSLRHNVASQKVWRLILDEVIGVFN
jgi:hypothetical protein